MPGKILVIGVEEGDEFATSETDTGGQGRPEASVGAGTADDARIGRKLPGNVSGLVGAAVVDDYVLPPAVPQARRSVGV